MNHRIDDFTRSKINFKIMQQDSGPNGMLQGISLIELLATLVILALLMVFSYNTYSQLIVEYRRKEAQSELMRVKNNLEKKALSLNKSVLDVLDTVVTPIRTANGYYNLGITKEPGYGGGAIGYTISALPNPASSQAKDRECPVISLTVLAGQEDVKKPDDLDPTKSCWK